MKAPLTGNLTVLAWQGHRLTPATATQPVAASVFCHGRACGRRRCRGCRSGRSLPPAGPVLFHMRHRRRRGAGKPRGTRVSRRRNDGLRRRWRRRTGCSTAARRSRSTVRSPSGWGLPSTPRRTWPRGHSEATTAALAPVRADCKERVVILFADTRSGDQADVVAGAYRAAGPFVPAGRLAEREGPIPPSSWVAAPCTTRSWPSRSARAPAWRGCRGRLLAGQRAYDGHGGEWPPPARARRRPAETVYLEKLGHAGVVLTDARSSNGWRRLRPLAQPELGGRRRHTSRPRARARWRPLSRHRGPRPGRGRVHDSRAGPGHSLGPGSGGKRDPGARRSSASGGADVRLRWASVRSTTSSRLRSTRSAQRRGARRLWPAWPSTHGEIGRIRGAKGDRNHALVVVAFG